MTPGAGIFRTQLPQGFFAQGINCGVRRYRPDLGMIVSEQSAVAAGVFTQSTCQAAPVVHSKALLPADNIKAVITNSGQANAATGQQGDLDNQAMVAATAEALNCDSTQVLAASTGVIGESMQIDLITAAIPDLAANVTNMAEKFALAIMTTDLVPKTVYKTLTLQGKTVTITGIAKGSGMIHPNMATMLGYLLTDVQMAPAQAQSMLTDVTNNSFNMISVDGDTSTNDSVFLLANGESGVVLEQDEDIATFQQALQDVAILLAKSIARDGEGATKLIEVQIVNAPDLDLAKSVARSLTVSPLIKTAIYGESPNWGRLIGRLGMAQVPAELLATLSIRCQDLLLYDQGQAATDDLQALKIGMREDTVVLTIDLKSGDHCATAWGCDLSERYVKINAEYVT